MELGNIFRIAGNAAAGITEGVFYAIGYAAATVAKELLIVVDEAIGAVVWGDDDE